VVRAAPARYPRILLSVPFATWQAYNRSGVPGEGLYWAEDPLRAKRVSFDRPGGGPPPERWEESLMRWLHAEGIEVDYCSDLDLHLDPGLLSAYRLMLVNGHDEYWTWEMRTPSKPSPLPGWAGTMCSPCAATISPVAWSDARESNAVSSAPEADGLPSPSHPKGSPGSPQGGNRALGGTRTRDDLLDEQLPWP
jgi:hypothetical protein